MEFGDYKSISSRFNTIRDCSLTVWLQATFALFGFFWPIIKYLKIRFGAAALVYDAGEVWQPLAEAVLAGQRLYVDIPENKPPLFQLLNVFANALGDYALIHLTLVGLANAGLIWLAGYHFYREGRPAVAILATVGCFLVLGPIGSIVNNKSLATTLLLTTTVLTSPISVGLVIGASIGIAQQTVLGIPAILWFHARRNGWHRHQHGKALIIAAGLFITSYLVVWGVWGWDSLKAGIKQTLLVAGEYSAATSQFQTTGGILSSPGLWLRRVSNVLQAHELLFAVAAVGIVSVVLTWRRRSLIDRFWVIYLGGLLPALAVRAYRHYWVLVVAGIGAMFAIGVESLYLQFNRER